MFLPGEKVNSNGVAEAASMIWLYTIIFLFFVIGVAAGGRVPVGYIMMCDFAPKKYHSLLGSIWNISEGLIYIYLTLYFEYISKDWRWPQFVGLIQAAICFAIICFIPESPKWLYEKERYQECYTVLETMAKVNSKHLITSARLMFIDIV